MATVQKNLYYSWGINPYADVELVSPARAPLIVYNSGGRAPTSIKGKAVNRRIPFMDSIKKTPYESFIISFNFSDLLLTSAESISSFAITCVNISTGVSSLSTIVSSSMLGTSAIVQVLVQNGNAGEAHKITVTATTSLGNVPELDCLLEVVDVTSRDMFVKQPGEKKVVANDFVNDMDTNDTINTFAITATKISDGTDVTSAVIYNSAKGNQKILLTVQDGADGEMYSIVIKIVATAGYKYQKDILMNVRAI